MGVGEAPDEWIISRVCEEFHCLPAAAEEAILEDVGFRVFKILELRDYAKAKHIYDTTPMDKRPKTVMMEKVSEITMGLAKRRIDEMKKKAEQAEESNKKPVKGKPKK